MRYDVIVIGSGFGGAITGARLAQAGCRVLILERGRRWGRSNYPRLTNNQWIWDNNAPRRNNGWIEFRKFKNMSIVAGAGVGGGSLVYANVACEAPPVSFAEGWPPQITHQEMRPHYDRVAEVIGIQEAF